MKLLLWPCIVRNWYRTESIMIVIFVFIASFFFLAMRVCARVCATTFCVRVQTMRQVEEKTVRTINGDGLAACYTHFHCSI